MAKDAEGKREGELSLGMMARQLVELQGRFGRLDSHIFASTCGLDKLKLLFEDVIPGMHLSEFCGMKVIHDPTVSSNEVEMGRLVMENGYPCKVVTKVFQLSHGKTEKS